MALDIVIRSEDDAWTWLQTALRGSKELDGPIDLKFRGWPTLDLNFKGRDFESSVPTRIMPPLLEAQREVQRLFCQLRYGTQNLRRLTNEDRERLELVVIVGKGSSKTKTNLQDVLTEAAMAAVKKMKSRDILIAVLSIALLWGSNVAWKEWLESKAQQTNMESVVHLSQEETHRLEILSKALKSDPALKELAEGVDEFRNDSLHQLKPDDTVAVQGDVTVDGEYAAKITHTPRAQSTEARIDGRFVIQSVVSGETKGYRLKVRRIGDDKIITVSVPDGALTKEQQDILKNAEWAKKPVILQINAKMLRDEVTNAILVSASEIDDKG